MIIDYILDRYEGGEYNSHDFYYNVMQYITDDISSADDITTALDFGEEDDVKRELCNYVINHQYNLRIIDYILSVDWIIEGTVAEKGTVDLNDKPVNDNEYHQQLEQYKIIISELGNNKSNNKEIEIEIAKEDRDYE